MTIQPKPTLGSVVQAHRQQHELGRRQLAQLIGVAPSQITRWELDQTVPSAASLVALSQQLEIRASVLFKLAGLPVPSVVQSLPAMLRAEYDLPPEAIAEIQAHIEATARKYHPPDSGQQESTTK